MRLSLRKTISFSVIIFPIIMIILYRERVPSNALVLSLVLDMLGASIYIRAEWLTYIMSISSIAILALYVHSIAALIVLLYTVFSSLIGVKTIAPIPRSEAKKLLPGIAITMLVITYASILTYSLTNTHMQGFRSLGSTGPGAAIIYGFSTLFATSLVYGYYSTGHIIPQEVLIIRRFYTLITPDNGFRLCLYLASITPAFIYHEPVYIIAAIMAYLIKFLIPVTTRLKRLDIMLYSVTYFILLKLMGAG